MRRKIAMNVVKMDRPNDGIKCEVNTCYYYMNGDYCSASKIEVQHKNAATSEDTDCATFKPQG